MRTVLIMTHRRGFEADPVIDMLRDRGVAVFRLNCDSREETSLISFAIDSEKFEIHLECDGRKLSGNDVGVGWCQQLPPYVGQPSDKFQCLQNENLWAAQFATLNSLKIPWLNRPENVIRASNKVLQLILARSSGLNVPDTLISNAPESIRTFAGDRMVVAKNLATPWVVSSQETYAAYTKLVSLEWLENDSELKFCPIIYQTYQRRKKDYRVVVVGDQIFAASCEPAKGQEEDIRREMATGESFVACSFDTDVVKRLKTLMEKLSINYCAADFMEDEKNNLYFLEMNVCGAWWWVDRLYNGVICNAIADYLQHFVT